MREILFRGKRVNDGEWVFGNFVRGCIEDFAYIVEFGNKELCRNYVEVIPESVSEFTGLTDKNGTKIFEGDILKFDYIGKNLGVNGVSLCEFENGKFGVKWGYHKEFVCLDGFANTTLEIIGNIHDNPELLKGK